MNTRNQYQMWANAAMRRLLPLCLLAFIGLLLCSNVLADSSIYLPIIIRGGQTPTPGAPPASATPTRTFTPSPTSTHTPQPTATATATTKTKPSSTPSPTATSQSTETPTQPTVPAPSASPTATATWTSSPSATPIPTNTPTATPTWTPSPTNTATWTPSPTPTATHTPTYTPTPVPTQCNTTAQVIGNPSFETELPPWEIQDGYPERTSALAADGLYSVWLGGYNDAMDVLVQEVSAPEWADDAALYFWWRMISDDSVLWPHDYLTLWVWDKNTNRGLLSCGVNNTATQGEWYRRRVSLASAEVIAARGHVLKITIMGYTDSTLKTMWYVDDVQLVFACGSQVP